MDHLLDEGNFILDFHLVPKFPRSQAPLFPSSAWEHTFAKLCFAIPHGKQSFQKTRDQAELGHEVKTEPVHEERTAVVK